MKNYRKKLIILSIIIASILIIAIVYTKNNNIIDFNTHKNSSETLELNEEYTKEDFDFSSRHYLTDKGKEKLARNNYRLVLDGNVIGDRDRISNNDIFDAFGTVAFEGYWIREIEFRNLDNLTMLEHSVFRNNDIQMLDLNPLKSLEEIKYNVFRNNKNLKEVHVEELKKLRSIDSIAFRDTNTKIYVAYKNPLGLKDAPKEIKYNYEYNDRIETINGHVIVDVVQNKLEEVKKEYVGSIISTSKQKELDNIKEKISKLFENEEEKNKWMRYNGYTEKEKMF